MGPQGQNLHLSLTDVAWVAGAGAALLKGMAGPCLLPLLTCTPCAYEPSTSASLPAFSSTWIRSVRGMAAWAGQGEEGLHAVGVGM